MSSGEILELLAVAVGVVVFSLAVVLVLHAGDRPARRRTRRERDDEAMEPLATTEGDRPLPAVVVNPTKFEDLASVRRQVTQACTELGWDEPLWLETTVEDPGAGQAREAIERGADVVMACGGDGTVRSVAEALAGSGVALGLLPAGTGNLLARNLDLDLDDLTGATRIALTGDDRPVDVGRISIDSGDERVFLVMAGMGFDAEIMSHAPESLKATVGPIAYTVAGLRQLKGEQMRVRLAVDDEPAIRRRVRTVVIGNCGKLLGGLVLMPDAKIDDGWLDAVSIAPEGVVGWVGVAGQVLTRQRRGHRRVEHWQVQAMTVASDSPQPAQLDGDPIGDVSSLRARIEHHALLVRVPADRSAG